MLEFLKKGSGIHIKPENKGKFTDYCGGNVTSECITKGKKSSNPVIRKRATFAQNARKWKHQMGGNLILDDEKQLDRQRYKEWNQLSLGDKFKRRLSIAGDQMKVPSIPRVFGALSALVGGYDPENPDLITGEAPLPSGIGKIPTIIKAGKTAKLTSGERALDKKIYSQIQRTIDKNARSMEAKDARMVNSGQSSIHKKQNNYDWETMKKYSEYNPAINRIEFKLTKYQKGSQGYKNAQEQKKNLIEQYRAKYRKQFGGNINFLQQGGFLQKAGNFLNSNTGKSIINGITGLAQTYSQNKQLQAEGAAQKALNEADYYKTLQEITSKNQEEQAQQYMNWVQAYQQGLTQDKPSDIVQSYIGNQQLNRKISNLKNDLNIQNKTINSMISKQTSNNWLNTFGGLVNTGIGLLSNNTSIKE